MIRSFCAIPALLWLLLAVCAARGEDLLDPLGETTTPAADSDLDDLLDGGDQGIRFRLVMQADAEGPIAEQVFWREVPFSTAAKVPPVEFRVDEVDLIVPVTKENSLESSYPMEGRAKLKVGRHVLTPGDIPIEVDGDGPRSQHPAIKVVEDKAGRPEVLILCAPVRFDAVDAAGVGVPTAIQVAWGTKSLLRKESKFNPLILWLPVGVEYSSSFGPFSLTASGKVEARPEQLAAGVKLTADGLRKVIEHKSTTAKPSSSNLIEFTVDATGQKFSAYVPPIASPSEGEICMAVSTAMYERATDRKLAIGQFSAAVAGNGTPENLALLSTVGKPSAAQDERAAEALSASVHELIWLGVMCNPSLHGPVSVKVQCDGAGAATTSVLIANVTEKLNLLPQRWRTAFAETERGTYRLFIAGPQTAESATIFVQSRTKGSKSIAIGKLQLPKVKTGERDSSAFDLKMSDLPPGDFDVWVEAGDTRSGRVPLTVVPWMFRSPFLVHSMSGCTECWPTTDQGLNILENAGLDMATATGAQSLLTVDMPKIDTSLAARLAQSVPGFPVELALAPTANDHLLSRMMRHRIRLIDLTTVRALGFYNESLSYHHSYPPSVDRMLRRMQIFTQQTGDYASFWGVNYSWFPQLYGYVEGGVPTDAHTGDRNRVLEQRVAEAGYKPLTADESKWLAEQASGNDDRAVKLAEQATAYFKAREDFGWGRHNKLYNDAVRKVRPDAVCTLFENAGHDEGKRTKSLFGDMTASCYESYTDFGDWPMSAAFTTDRARGEDPARPVWLTTCWGTSSAGMMKSLFHAFARGLAGGGVPLQATNDDAELIRRGTGMKFIGAYGALARDARPDARVAILSRPVNQTLTPRGMWYLHALYYQLTRLGYPPVILAEETLNEIGASADTKVLFLAQERWPLEAKTAVALAKFVERGGKVVLAGESSLKVPGAIAVNLPLKQLWDLGGFEGGSHRQMWQEFTSQWSSPLAETMKNLGIEPLASTEVDRGLALGMTCGDARYVVVISDAKDNHSNDFERPEKMKLSLEGADWIVRDLVKQQTLETTGDGTRTTVSVDLVTEPTTILALTKATPTSVEVTITGAPMLGADLVFNANVKAGKQVLGHVPVQITLQAPGDSPPRTWYESTGHVQRAPLATLGVAGKWLLTVQELITGLTATAEIDVSAPSAKRDTAVAIGDVHVTNRIHLESFAHDGEEKLVIIEPGQQSLLPLAKQLVAAIQSAGGKARVWQVQPEEFDTIPIRWYPRPEDEARLAEVAAGKLVGYRGNLAAFIHKLKRTHIPELGGYAEIDPPFMVGSDCVVFSGGKLAESLRAVSPWLDTPNSPGRGQGRLLVAHSALMANRNVAAVVANDSDGFSKAVKTLAKFFEQPTNTDPPLRPAAPPKLAVISSKLAKRSIDHPYRNYAPLQRVERLLATRDGKAVLLLAGKQDDLAMVDDLGKVTATVKLGDVDRKQLHLDAQGHVHLLEQKVLAKDPSWHFPTAMELTLQTLDRDGKLLAEMPAFSGDITQMPPDYRGGFRVAPDGQSAILSRASSLLFGKLGELPWQRYNDLPHVVKRFEVLYPRVPVGATFSPDGRYVLATFDSRPPFGGMGTPAYQPTSSETVLLDLTSGERVWSLRDPDYQKATYAAHTGFAVVAKDAERTALAGCDGAIFLLDKSGKILVQEQVITAPADVGGRIGPADGVGVWMAESGDVAAYGFKNVLVFVEGTKMTRLPLAGLVSCCVNADGSLIVAGLRDGQIVAYNAEGKPQWTIASGGPAPLVASIGDKAFLAATADGKLLQLNSAGQMVRSTDVAKAADADRHPVQKSAEYTQRTAVPDYREPETLAFAKQHLAAKPIGEWNATGDGVPRFGRKFYPLSAPAKLEAGDAVESFLHLVYGRGEENKSLTVTIEDERGKTEFMLDLPTPEYRVVDLPLRGVGASATIAADGPAEIAECSLWSLEWPSNNQAYVAPAGGNDESAPAGKQKEQTADDLLDEFDEKSEAVALKKCKIYCPNSDVDRIAGAYLPVPLDPYQVVDGDRFEAGKLPAWAPTAGKYFPTRGSFFTIDFNRDTPLSLVATYDRALKQSAVCASLVVFSGEDLDEVTSGKVLSGVAANDQFWRLFSLSSTELRVLGVHVFAGTSRTVGLSEVEVYK